MGDGVGFIGAKAAASVVASLNDMFNANIATTATNFGTLSKLYPQLLVYDANQTNPRKARQSGLRFAAWLMTSDIVFSGPNVNHPYPADKFVKWLKYCRWLDVSNATTIPTTLNGANPNPKQPQPATQVISKVLYDNLKLKNPIPVQFSWTEDATAKLTMITIVTTDPKKITIDVVSPKADDLKISDDGEDFQDH